MSNTKRPGHTLPGVDSSNNLDMADVIGNKTDTHDGDSVYALLKKLEEHVHKQSRVYPTLANAVTVTGGAGAWALGSFVEIVPANTITSDFDIHYFCVTAISAIDNYEIVFYAGETEVGRSCFTKATGVEPDTSLPIQTPIIAANSQIQAKLATQGGGSDTADIRIKYHTY